MRSTPLPENNCGTVEKGLPLTRPREDWPREEVRCTSRLTTAICTCSGFRWSIKMLVMTRTIPRALWILPVLLASLGVVAQELPEDVGREETVKICKQCHE